MDFYVEMSPPSTSLFSYSTYASSGSSAEPTSLFNGSTKFLAIGEYDVNVTQRDISPTAKLPLDALKGNTAHLPSGSAVTTSLREFSNDRFFSSRDAEVSKIAADRIKLLAMKYASDSVSTEVMARLAILNSRLIKKSPRVTTEQISSLEQTIASVKSIEASRLERAKRLGLAV